MDLFGLKARRERKQIEQDLETARQLATRRAEEDAVIRIKLEKFAKNDNFPTRGVSTLHYAPDHSIALASTATISYSEKSHSLSAAGQSHDYISRQKFESIASAAQNYGSKIMAGQGSSWHRFGDDLLNVGALRWMEYDAKYKRIKFDGRSIENVEREQFERAAKDYAKLGAMATGGKVSSVMRVGDELVNLNALGRHHYDAQYKRLYGYDYQLAITPRQWQRVQIRQQRYDRAINTTLTARTQMLAQFGSAQAAATAATSFDTSNPGIDNTALLATAAVTAMIMSGGAEASPVAPFTSGGGGDFGGGGATGSYCDPGPTCAPN